MGGLGNLMFQYGLGKHIAYKNKVDLKFDISSQERNPVGDYSFSLEGFNINIRKRVAAPQNIERLKRYSKRPGRRWFFYNLLFADGSKYVKEEYRAFNPHILQTKDDAYLDGYWQNEKYFIDIRHILLEDFTLSNPLKGANERIAQKISETDAVSMHVRRQDYINDPLTKERYVQLTKQYYDKALTIIHSEVKNPTLFIFSDDISWIKENMAFPFKTVYVEGNMNAPHEDIHLMSLCKHHVTANSSFSWWGAWLSTNTDKIVVTPRKWTRNPYDPNVRSPANWTALEID